MNNSSTQWISVSDSLPPMEKKVLVCNEADPETFWLTKRSEVRFFKDDNAFVLFDVDDKITHWAPITSLTSTTETIGIGQLDYKAYYPITIVQDRYGGTYSKAAFLCFGCDFDEVPTEVNSDDVTCRNFWESCQIIVGKGATPVEALNDYTSKYKPKNHDIDNCDY